MKADGKVAEVLQGIQVSRFMEAERVKDQRSVEATDILKEAKQQRDEILQNAEEDAAKIRTKIDTEWDEHKKRMSDVSAEVVGRVIDQRQISEGARVIVETAAAANAVRRDFEALDPWLTELVRTCMQRILGETPSSEVWRGTIKQCLKTIRSRWDLQLSCHPKDFDAISEVVSKHPDFSGEGFHVKADYQLERNTCILVHPDGAVDISVSSLVNEMCKYITELNQAAPITEGGS